MIGVLGGGLSGLALASRLPDAEVLEAAERPGGLCRSVSFEGFTFDPHGSHILFSRDPRAMGFYEALLGENVCRRRRNTKVFYKGRYVKYPFENGLGELPPEDNLACLLGYVTAYAARKAGTAPRPTNLREWMYHRFGKGITECYLLPYNEKIWKAPAAEMGFDWVRRSGNTTASSRPCRFPISYGASPTRPRRCAPRRTPCSTAPSSR